MKKQRYVVEIEMPDGDFISAGWLKDLIQTDCDVEDESRKKVNVQETSLPSNLDEAAKKWKEEHFRREYYQIPKDAMSRSFKAGAEWMARQGVSMQVTDDTEWSEVDLVVHKNVCEGSIIQIRNK